MKKPFSERFGDFMAGKGFYIVLLLCVTALGVSGYYLFSGFDQEPAKPVSGSVTVVVTPAPTASGVTPTAPTTATTGAMAAIPTASTTTCWMWATSPRCRCWPTSAR